MKLSTLKGFFRDRARRTKLYLIIGEHPREFLIAGCAHNPREEGEVLLLDIGPYVVYSFQRDQPLVSRVAFRGLRLEAGSRVTRKFQTHRRNVLKLRDADTRAGLGAYFEAAWTIGEEPAG